MSVSPSPSPSTAAVVIPPAPAPAPARQNAATVAPVANPNNGAGSNTKPKTTTKKVVAAPAGCVATAVTAPLERQFGQVAGLSQMTSTSAGGVSAIVMEFQLSLSIDVAEQEVQAAINAAQSYLPVCAIEP